MRSFAAMAVTVKQMALIVAFFGVLSFIFGIVAENKKVITVLCMGLCLMGEIGDYYFHWSPSVICGWSFVLLGA